MYTYEITKYQRTEKQTMLIIIDIYTYALLIIQVLIVLIIIDENYLITRIPLQMKAYFA